tara:strand:- start:2618 stop:2830 length:213 start_codon:yes stop_codon:yes gene_type:complete
MNAAGLLLKTGIVVSETSTNITVQWLSYNKSYFLEKEDDIFRELNNMYLLSLQSIHRNNIEVCLHLLSAN